MLSEKTSKPKYCSLHSSFLFLFRVTILKKINLTSLCLINLNQGE